jgi:glycosyltransferase involved in cell wall biosynthesis
VKSPDLKFVIMGDGPLKDKFAKLSSEEEINVIFTGRLAYDEMCSVLRACDMAINPIMQGAAQSIINKHADYAMAGLPVINTQENEEYRDLLKAYQCGVNCEPGSVNDIAKALDTLIASSKMRKTMGAGSRRMAEEKFDREQTYKEIYKIIEKKG